MQKNTEIQLATQEATEEIADWTLSGVVIDGLGGLFLALAGFIAFRTYRQTVRHADAAEKTLAQTVAQAKQSAIDGEKQIVAAQRQAAAAEKQLSEAIAANKKSIAASERLARMTELQAKANINAIQEESKLRALSVRPKFLFYEADVKITHDTIHIIARIKNEGDYTIRDLTFAYAIGFPPRSQQICPMNHLSTKSFSKTVCIQPYHIMISHR